MGKKCISIVVPMYNEQESLQILYRELNRVTREMGDYDFEYVFVNDGSKDATLQKIRELAAEDERVHVEIERDGRVSELADAVHRLKAPRHPDLVDALTE